jgi:hypothetical protein
MWVHKLERVRTFPQFQPCSRTRERSDRLNSYDFAYKVRNR